MKPITEDRNAAVLVVLNSTKAPLGPTEIARRINQPWCKYGQSAFLSSAISPILKRIKAVRHNGGEWTAPEKITI